MKKFSAVFVILLFGFNVTAHAAAANPKAMQQMKKNRAQAAAKAAGTQQAPAVPPEEMAKIVTALKTSSQIWPKVPNAAKIQAVAYFIQEYGKKGVTIRKSPNQYASMINGITAQNPQMLTKPLEAILQVVAIVEHDFGNGQDPDLMARKLLGEAGYLNNKKRLEKSQAQKPA